ncbi:Z-DNA-binding protein [Caudoviricetes sp.]|nr:Z-DNA-binding protein [Caudoviricetes sp.]
MTDTDNSQAQPRRPRNFPRTIELFYDDIVDFGLEEALVIAHIRSHLLFLLMNDTKEDDLERWNAIKVGKEIYKRITLSEWLEEYPILSKTKITRIVSRLEKLGVISSMKPYKVREGCLHFVDTAKYYTITAKYYTI